MLADPELMKASFALMIKYLPIRTLITKEVYISPKGKKRYFKEELENAHKYTETQNNQIKKEKL